MATIPGYFIGRTILALAVLVACTAAYFIGTLAAGGLAGQKIVEPAVQTVNGLFIDPNALRLPEMWETRNYSVTLSVKNVSNEQRTIRSFEPTCDCTAVEPRTLTLASGETAQVKITLEI